MIEVNCKSLDEILRMTKPYKKVLFLGCNECATVCAVSQPLELADAFYFDKEIGTDHPNTISEIRAELVLREKGSGLCWSF
jgi:hypothetical protein